MATHGEIRWPSVGSFDGRLRGDSHGRRQSTSARWSTSHGHGGLAGDGCRGARTRTRRRSVGPRRLGRRISRRCGNCRHPGSPLACRRRRCRVGLLPFIAPLTFPRPATSYVFYVVRRRPSTPRSRQPRRSHVNDFKPPANQTASEHGLHITASSGSARRAPCRPQMPAGGSRTSPSLPMQIGHWARRCASPAIGDKRVSD
jgi:hypothetical protein